MEHMKQKLLRASELLSLVSPVLTDASSIARINAIQALISHCGRAHVAPDGVSHAYLEKTIQCLPRAVSSKFQGVFTLDKFDIKKTNMNAQCSSWFIIINLATRSSLLNGKVGHFVFFMKRNEEYCYIDPLGREPESPYVLNQICLNRKGYKHKYNSYKIQSSGSAYCGIYCLCFALLFSDNTFKIDDLKKMFSLNDYDELNDKRSVSYITKYIQKM